MSRRAASKRGGSPAGVRALGCLGLAALIVALWLGFDNLEAPWAYSLFGRPTLTGHWAGAFTTPSGIHFALYLELERGTGLGAPLLNEGDEVLSGHANWCDERGRRVERNPLSGSVPQFAGLGGVVEPVDIHIEPSNAPVGLVPVNLHGQWQGDTLTFKSELSFWTGNALQSSSSNVDQSQPSTIVLTKAEVDAFQSACVGWGRG